MTNLKRTVVMGADSIGWNGDIKEHLLIFTSCSQGLTGIKITEIGKTQLHVFNLTFEDFFDLAAS